MTDRMSQVQECSVSLLGRILFYNHTLDITAIIDHQADCLRILVINLIQAVDDPAIKHTILDQCAFQHFTHTCIELPFR